MDDNEISWGKPSFEELREHYTTPNTRVDPRSVLVQQASNSSIDLDESFKAILQKRRRKAAESVIIWTPVTANKKTPNKLADETSGNRLIFEKIPSMDSEQSSWMNCGDDTFLNIEKMCENTVLENTLEVAAVERLLSEFKAVDFPQTQPEHKLLLNLNDMTQLNDIEAPSTMWDQTFLSAAKASPLKLVHISRPSTIIEESTFLNSSKEESKVLKMDSLQEVNVTLDLSESVSTETSFDGHISLDTTNNESFETAKATESSLGRTSYETANDKTLSTMTKTLSDVNVFPLKKKRYFYDAPFAQSLSISTASSTPSDDSLLNVQYEKNSAFLDSLEVIELSSKESTKDTYGENDDDNDFLQEDSLLQNDKNINDLLEAPNFNDTLEEMDFIMKHGMKFMEQQKTYTKNTPTVLKQQNLNTKSTQCPTFENKTDRATKNHTPTTFKKPQAISRLPVLKSNSKKFDHIVSPIHTYIKDAPQYPLITKQKGGTGLIDKLHDPNRRDTVFSQNNENLFTEDPSYKPVIPLKGVISTQQSRMYDARTPIKMPGGEKVHKLIGNHTPTVIKHEGRFKSYANVAINADDTVDDSFMNLSVASGDVSIQVVKNVNRV